MPLKFDSSSDKLFLKLKGDWALLKKSAETLETSVKRCSRIGTKKVYTFEESESFDALTSKFARTSDILTQKEMKTLISILREEADTFVSRMNIRAIHDEQKMDLKD